MSGGYNESSVKSSGGCPEMYAGAVLIWPERWVTGKVTRVFSVLPWQFFVCDATYNLLFCQLGIAFMGDFAVSPLRDE